MAKQAGEIFIEGSFDDLCFYRLEGKYYVRRKSSLNSRKFWKHKAFEGSRKSCQRFAEGNRLASKLYRMVKEEKRAYKLFCFIKKKAILLIKEGKSLGEAEDWIIDYLTEFGLLKPKEQSITVEEIQKVNYGNFKAPSLPLFYFHALLKADSS